MSKGVCVVHIVPPKVAERETVLGQNRSLSKQRAAPMQDYCKYLEAGKHVVSRSQSSANAET